MPAIFEALPGFEVPVGAIGQSLARWWEDNAAGGRPAPEADDAKATQETPRWMHVDVKFVRKTVLVPLDEYRYAQATMHWMREHGGMHRQAWIGDPHNRALVESVLERVSSEITKLGGTVSESRVLGRREFARPLHKIESGLYARVAFKLDPGAMAALRGRLKLVEDIFRIQIVKVEAAA